MATELSPHQRQFLGIVKNRFKFRLFLLRRLPLAWITGLRIEEMTAETATVSVKYGYWTKNPFRSIYFAVLAMAAELSTGLLGFLQIYQRKLRVSMLVTDLQASYSKKAVGRIRFTCESGAAIATAVARTIETGEGEEVPCVSVGRNEAGEEVARLTITWSFKAKRGQ